jgi:bzd-type benzoyl-CoA reductase Q subunit
MVNGKDDRREFWRWTERRWHDPDIDWKKANMITAGVDVGSVSAQFVVFVDDKPFASGNTRTGGSSPDSALEVTNWALEGTGMTIEDLQYTVGTGYGQVNVPFGQKAITEIACHGRGANWIYGPSIRTVLDMGGQDCKVIHVDDKGKVRNFLMNDKCAAGTGRGMEVFANLLGIPIMEIGDLSFQVEEEPPMVSSTCVVYAKAEATRLLRSGWPKEKVIAAYCAAMAHRVMGLLERIGVEKEFGITGGICKNEGVVKRLENELGFQSIKSDKFDVQCAGAVGAALFAQALLRKQRS